MAFADTQQLVVELNLKGDFSKKIADARRSVKGLDVDVDKLNSTARRGFSTLSRNVALIGVAAAGGIAVMVKNGLSDLAELEDAVTSIDGAIAQLGLTGQLTGKQVADWANDIERDIDAAFDDKAIAQSATTLLRYGKIAPKALRPALEVVADLAAKTGDVESASEALAKALAKPEAAAGRLARLGVILTKAQQDQIKAMVKAGDVAGAQAVLLDAVAASTKGAAKAMAGPYQDALNKTNDAMEDARKALAIGFLPVIEKVADKLSDITADEDALASIKEFGQTLAGGLDNLIDVAERLPWDAIGTSLRIGGLGAKAILDAFTALPPWVQTAVLTGWGLNKLTGGALGGIVSELGKGLIKGVLGMNAGVVNINAGVVNGGGVPGAPVTGGKPGGGISGALGTIAKVTVIGAVAVEGFNVGIGSITSAIDENNKLAQAGLTNEEIIAQRYYTANKADQQFLFKQLHGVIPPRSVFESGNAKLQGIQTQLTSGFGGMSIDARDEKAKLDAVTAAVHNSAAQDRAIAATAAANAAAAQQAAFSIRDKVAAASSSANTHLAALQAKARETANAAREAGRQTAAAIRDKDLSVTVNTHVNTRVSIQQFNKTYNTYKATYGVAS